MRTRHLAAITLLAACSPSPAERAVSLAEEAIREALLAPSTATIGGLRAYQGAGYWWVEGHVDAENRFGAMIRRQFVVGLEDQAGTLTVVSTRFRE